MEKSSITEISEKASESSPSFEDSFEERTLPSFEEQAVSSPQSLAACSSREEPSPLVYDSTSLRGVPLRWSRINKAVECTGTATSPLMRGSISGHSTLAYTSKNVYTKTILDCVSGTADPGQVLGILGPNGAGKSTLLNVLSGRTSFDGGEITVQGRRLDKTTKHYPRNMIAYVQQDDIFFDHLTVRDQLTYIGLLRLSGPKKDKLHVIESTINVLKLQECVDSPIRLLSGGERKRVNIGTELLLNPSIVLMDEPTSSLDAANSREILSIIRKLAVQQRKTVITTIHQPTSTTFHSFDKVMIMVNGSVVFTGTPEASLTHLASVGYTCPRGYNIADYWLDLLVLNGQQTSEESTAMAATDSGGEEWVRDPQTRRRSSLASFRGVRRWTREQRRQRSSPKARLIQTWDKEEAAAEVDREILTSQAFHVKKNDSLLLPNLRQASWLSQFYILLHRSLKNSKAVVFTPINGIKSVCTGVVVGLLWFNMPYTEDYVFDRESYLFFTLSYWVFDVLFDALMAFPLEKTILYKERASRAYGLSAYFMAKTVSEMPVRLGLPLAYMLVSYWMAGVNDDFGVFVGVTFIMLVAVMAGESLGLLIGALFMDLDKALAIMVVVAHALLVAGGFFVQNVPNFMQWLQYLSVFKYAYDASRILVFNEDVPCVGSGQLESICHETDIGVAEVDDLLNSIGVQGSLAFNIGLLFVTMFVPRYGAYLALKHQKIDVRY